MTLYNELFCVTVGIVSGLLLGFVGRCCQEYGEKCSFKFVIFSGVFVFQIFWWLFFLPLKVLLFEKARKDILRVLIRGAEKKHQAEGHHEIQLTETTLQGLVDTLVSMTGRYDFFKFSLKLMSAGLKNCDILADTILKIVYEIMNARQKISSEKVEYQIATKSDVSIYRDYYPTLSLPCL